MTRNRRITLGACAVVVVLATTGAVVGATATGTHNGLTAAEVATLWSRDTDDGSVALATNTSGQDSLSIQTLANGTDIVFDHPPATAAIWSRHDFSDLNATNSSVSRYPPHATLVDGKLIADAHATIFGVHPATRAHLGVNRTPLYIASEGTVRAYVDYRVRTREGTQILDHTIKTVRLHVDGQPVAATNRTQTPQLNYSDLEPGRRTITVRAEIEVTWYNETQNTTNVTVTDRRSVVVYEPTTKIKRVAFPDGDRGIGIKQEVPWTRIHLRIQERTSSESVRGIWRFYTARQPLWDEIYVTTGTGTRTVTSSARPVYVHAYPARVTPQTRPVLGGPHITQMVGVRAHSPGHTIGESIAVDVVGSRYRVPTGIALRTETARGQTLRLVGLVRGVNRTLNYSTESVTEIRRSNLTTQIVNRNGTHVRIVIQLRDAATGTPIALTAAEEAKEDQEQTLTSETEVVRQTGYISVRDRHMLTNDSGMAVVVVNDPGPIRITYHADSWIGQQLAFTDATAVVGWHPLLNATNWYHMLTTLLQYGSLVVVAGLVARSVHRLFTKPPNVR